MGWPQVSDGSDQPQILSHLPTGFFTEACLDWTGLDQIRECLFLNVRGQQALPCRAWRCFGGSPSSQA